MWPNYSQLTNSARLTLIEMVRLYKYPDFMLLLEPAPPAVCALSIDQVFILHTLLILRL